MTDSTLAPSTPFVAADPSPRDYAPTLEFYHPNGKGSGAALKLELSPASSDQDGCIFLTAAQQSGVGAPPAGPDQPRRFASFDWQNRITVKIGFGEVCDLLLVFAGAMPVLAHAGKPGFFHSTANATTTVELKRGEDPARPGFLLGIGKTQKTTGNRQFIALFLSPSEAYGLRLALEQSMGLLAFGIPRLRAPRAAAPSVTPPPAVPTATNVYGLTSALPPPAAPVVAPVAAAVTAAVAAAPADDTLAAVPGGF